MLSEILSLMKNRESYTLQQLAEYLEASPEEVQRSIEYLEYLGYIQKISVESGCCNSCKNCHGCDTKRLTQMPVLWKIN